MQIAIDGPAGAGKSTIAKKLSKKLGFVYVDTGAFYRTIAYYYVENNINYENEDNVKKHIDNINIDVKWENFKQIMFLNGEDVTNKIRNNNVAEASSKISVYRTVRDFLLSIQQDIAGKNDVIMDGRDIGTVVLKDANYKFFVTASVERRANRRMFQLKKIGEQANFRKVVAEIKKRDFRDSTREIAPLIKANDAYLINNTNLNLNKTVLKILKIMGMNEKGS